MKAQTGDNAVYTLNAQQLTVLATSPAFIDAVPWQNGGDLCNTINRILIDQSYPSTGAVVDARGILPQSGQSVTCGSNPFLGVNNPSVVLLPPTNIKLTTTWTLPDNTRIIGEGSAATYLLATSTLTGDMIQMAYNCTSVCSGISIEHLALDGQAQCPQGPPLACLNGIVNYNAQESSYVDDVQINDILGTALSIQTGATGSGPYSNINSSCPDCATKYQSKSTCVEILATTRGLHGVTCVAKSSSQNQPPAAIRLDANNNTIEDVHIEGYYDGVLVGSGGNAEGNTLLNIDGGSGTNTPLTNLVHICNPKKQTTNCLMSSFTITDLGIFQVGVHGSGGSSSSTTILDDLTSSTTTSSPASDAYVGMYVIGNNSNAQVAGYSRFNTTPDPNLYSSGGGLPTLAIPTGPQIPIVGASCALPTGGYASLGVIYANPGGTKGSSNTLFVCINSSGGPVWTAIKPM